jgi:hypothetical protein
MPRCLRSPSSGKQPLPVRMSGKTPTGIDRFIPVVLLLEPANAGCFAGRVEKVTKFGTNDDTGGTKASEEVGDLGRSENILKRVSSYNSSML